MIDDLNDALDSIEDRRQLCALSISGNGRALCAGAGFKPAKERMSSADTAAINSQFLEAFPMPVFTAMNGLALAGSQELVMACDLVIAAESTCWTMDKHNHGKPPCAINWPSIPNMPHCTTGWRAGRVRRNAQPAIPGLLSLGAIKFI